MPKRVAALAALPLMLAACGATQSQSSDVRSVGNRYVAALAADNGAEACSLLTGEAKRELIGAMAAFGPRDQTRSLSCPEDVKLIYGLLGTDDIAALKRAHPTVVSMTGSTARVRVSAGAITTDVPLSKTPAGWLVSHVSPAGAESAGGGLLAKAAENERRESTSFASQIKRYRALTRAQPSDLSAWEHLTEALLHVAGGEAYVAITGRVTRKGKELLGEAARAWQTYLGLNPPQPNAKLAQVVLAIYAPGGLNQPAQAVRVLQILVQARPSSAAWYAELAEYAYRAKKPSVGDRASEKAVRLAPSAARSRLRRELEGVKRHGAT